MLDLLNVFIQNGTNYWIQQQKLIANELNEECLVRWSRCCVAFGAFVLAILLLVNDVVPGALFIAWYLM